MTEYDNDERDHDDIRFATIEAVDVSWNCIRAIPNYEAVAGEILFRKIFELAPSALGMYSFGAHFVDDDGLYSSPLFLRHAKGVVQMLDAAIQMLGPDMEPLSQILRNLGAKHTHYGVLPPHYAIVGQALLYTLETALGDKWTPQVQSGWEGIYQFVSTTMMEGAVEFLAKKDATEKEQPNGAEEEVHGKQIMVMEKEEESVYATIEAVDTSWNRIRAIPNYEAVAGEILFRKIFELAPGALGMYSFGARFVDDEDGLYSSPLFLRHAKGVVQMLDAAIQMLGPDLEPLSEILKELGAKHTHYGVLPPHYTVVGQALLYTLETALGDKWTPQVQSGWEGIYQFVSTTMMEGAEEFLAKREAKGREESKKEKGQAHQNVKNTSYEISASTMSKKWSQTTSKRDNLRRLHRIHSMAGVFNTELDDRLDGEINSSVKCSDKSAGHRHRGRAIVTWIEKALKITAGAENIHTSRRHL
jgi:hemoglobin-like flavoprotein